MAFSQSSHAILVMGIVFCVSPHFNTGLLSDYKICGDLECQSPMSRVQAIRDHRGKDCRYLNFRSGDTIFVYHKLTGKRDDLWAGTIDRQFGYFPKDAVQEELLYVTVENVVATQESDFFCMDEFGYLVDSSHLDNDANEDDAVKNQEQETTQTTPYLDDNNAEGISTSEEVFTESVGSAQESESSIKEEAEGNTNADDDAGAAGTHKEAEEDPAASAEQGGSASSSWLGSSVTGWIGLTKEEEPTHLAEEQKEEAKEETPEASSYTSSMTGWLGFGGGGKGDDEEVISGQEDAETSETYTSTVTGWLGFGGEKKNENSAERAEEERNRHEEQEQAETFRSRRMSLDLEGSQLHEEEEKEAGTFDWLGNRLTSTLGFGQTNQESETTAGQAEEAAKEEQQASGSWYDMGFGDMLGLGTDTSTGESFQGTQMEENLDQNPESEREDTSQSQPTVTEEMTTEVRGESQDDIPSETENAESKSALDDDGVSSDSAASEAIGGMPSMPDNSTQIETLEKEEHDVSNDDEKEKSAHDEERPTEMEGDHLQITQTIKYNDDDDRQTREEDFKTAQDILTQSDTGPLLDFGLKSDATEQSAGEVKEDIRENLLGDSAGIQGKTDESANKSHGISARGDSDDFEENKETKTEDATGESQTGSGAEDSSAENTDPISNKHETLTQVEDTTDQEQEGSIFNKSHRKSEAEIKEEEESRDEGERREQGEVKEEEEVVKTQGKQQEADEEKTDEQEKQQEVQEISEKEKPVELEELKDETIQKEVEEREENQEEVGESKDEENHGEEEAKEEEKQLKTQEKHQRVDEEKKDGEEELNEEGKEQEVGDITEREKLVELKETIQREMEEIEENQEEVGESKDVEIHGKEEAKEEEKRVDLEDEKQINTQEKHQGVNKEKKDEEEELKEEEKQQEVEESTEREKLVKLEELKDRIQKEPEDIKENQEELGESKEEKHREEEAKEDEMETLKEEEKDEVEEEQKQIEEFKERTNGAVEELKVMEQREDSRKLEEEGEKERKDSKEEPTFEPNMGNISNQVPESKEEEVNSDKSPETSTQSEERQRQNPQVQIQEENKQTEHMNEVKEAVEKVGKEKREQEEGECKGECMKARDRKDSLDAVAEKTDPVAELTEGTQTVSEGTERDEEGVKEEERNDDAENRKTEDVNSKSSDIISDPDALGFDQTEGMKYTTNDLPQFVKVIQDDRSGEDPPDQTAEVKANNHLDSTELRGGETLHQESETNDAETKWKIEQTNADSNIEEREITVKHHHEKEDEDADVKVAESYQSPGTELNEEEKIQASEVFESQAEVSEQTAPQHSTGSPLPSDDPENRKTESGGAFGLFRNAFGFFRQIPAPEAKEPTQSLDSYTLETPEAHTSLTPEQAPDTSQVYSQDLHTDIPVTVSEQPPSPTQTSHIHSSAIPENKESPIQSKTFSKHYKNLLTYMTADDTGILVELFGRHKLQFLDDISGSTETMTGNPDTDESILLDIERLLHHHREILIAPSMKIQDVQHEDKEKTRALIALQKLEMLLDKVRETFSTGKADTSYTQDQDGSSCVEGSCSTSNKETFTEVDAHVIILDSHTPKDEQVVLDEEEDKQIIGGWATEDEEQEPQKLKGTMQQMINNVHKIAEDLRTHVHAARELLIWLTIQVVSALPDDIRPGPDLYGVPWEPVIVSSLVGLVTVLLFTCRCYSSVKSRLYRSKEHWMAEQVSQLLDEKCKVLETLSKCQQEYDDLETSLRDSGVLAQTQKTEQLEAKARQLGHAKNNMERDLEELKDQLDQQREHRKEQERRIAVLEESMQTYEEEAKDLQSQDEQAQTTLKVYSMNSERLQRNVETAGEENTLLQESNAQLRQQVEGWAERVGELEAEISRCKVAHSGMLQDVTNKDERIWSLTDRLLRMKAWDSDLEEEGYDEGEKETSNGTAERGGENGKGDRTETPGHLQKVQKLIYAAKLNADLKSVDEDKDRAFAKLNDEIKAKEDLQVSIKELENEKLSLLSDSEHYSDQVQRLQQKLNIMTEMYQENELKLHRLLTVEEKDRMQKEERLNKADKNIALAMEELNNYRQRAEEMEEELEKTKQSYQTQISAHEKKAHNNWLASRAAERELADIRRENALLRQKLTDTQFKLDTLDKDPYALDNLARPLPFRAERSPYGPSPLGRPASETRAFLSPPTLMDGPPARLSPRVPRGPVEPPGGQMDMERSGGPHSDSGSISPTWERDRRGPPPGHPGPPPGHPGPPGYMFPEPGAPIYRRPPPPPGALGPFPASGPFPPGVLPPRGLPPGPYHPAEMGDASFRENSFGPGDQDPRESGAGDRRTPPEADSRMGGPPPPGPPMGPGDGPFPRRAPYGPPPPDFYPPRGPGIPPMRPMWAPPPPGMMYPPRFPHGGPPPPHQAPPMRPPLSDIHPPPSMGPPLPRQPLPSPPHSQSPEEHTPSPEDAI